MNGGSSGQDFGSPEIAVNNWRIQSKAEPRAKTILRHKVRIRTIEIRLAEKWN